MALLACVECGHAVGQSAPSCPRCGCPDPAVSPPAFLASRDEPKAVSDQSAQPGVVYCAHCGKPKPPLARFCPSCGGSNEPAAEQSPEMNGALNYRLQAGSADEARMLERIAGYERASSIIWLVFGILQVLSLVAIIAGIWNILAAISRFKLPEMIRARDRRIPGMYEGVTQLIIIGVLNLFVGGVIGVLFVAFDFYVRSLILQHRHLFASPTTETGAISQA